MAWTIEISNIAEKQIKKLDKSVQKKIINWLFDKIEGCKNPRHFGSSLKGDLNVYWRYKIGNYRVLCEIQDNKLIVLVITIGHRKNIYKKK